MINSAINELQSSGKRKTKKKGDNMIGSIEQFFYNQGYHKEEDNNLLLSRETDDFVYLVQITGMTYDTYSKPEDYIRKNQQLIFQYHHQTGKNVEVLNLIFIPSVTCKGIKEIADNVPNVWAIEQQTNRLILFENQNRQFDHLYGELETWLMEPKKGERKRNPKGYPVTLLLIGMNLIVFLILSKMGDVNNSMFMLSHGAAEYHLIFQQHEYYRIFTSMFLHFGWEHLFNNMVVLLIAGMDLEPQLGKLKYLVLYLCSGLFGGIVSMVAHSMTETVVVAAGASGAIYGVIGALIAWIGLNPKKRKEFSWGWGMILIAGTLYMSVQDSSVDSFAHLSGAVMGMILGTIFFLWNRRGEQKRID